MTPTIKPADAEQKALPRHFYSLDALRGIAAFAVVFYHWRQFFYTGTVAEEIDPHRFPLYALLQPVYNLGNRSVDLFFCLSGFIFFWLYSERVRSRKMSLREFAVLRFSRLYPLHFLTLLAVAAEQRFSLWRNGTFLIFDNNDLYHFVLQIAFAGNWGFERGYSFNAPSWSVSVEVVLYAVFFVVCSINLTRWWQLLLLVGGGFVVMRFGVWEMGRGLFSFFIGGLSFMLFMRLWRLRLGRRTLTAMAVVLAMMWIVIPYEVQHHAFTRGWASFVTGTMLSFHGRDPLGLFLAKLLEFSFEVLLFPTTLITLALWESYRGTLGRRLRWLGNTSYSSYLLHVPLQIAFLLIVTALGASREYFSTTASLVLFFAVLIVLSLTSYHYFERPWQSKLRGLFISQRPTCAPSAAKA